MIFVESKSALNLIKVILLWLHFRELAHSSLKVQSGWGQKFGRFKSRHSFLFRPFWCRRAGCRSACPVAVPSFVHQRDPLPASMRRWGQSSKLCSGEVLKMWISVTVIRKRWSWTILFVLHLLTILCLTFCSQLAVTWNQSLVTFCTLMKLKWTFVRL